MKFIMKYYFKFIYWLFIIGLFLVVFVRDSIDNELIVLIINYYFWYSFGLVSGVFLSNIIRKSYNKSNNGSK